MIVAKNLGIWMNHSTAHLFNLLTDYTVINIVASGIIYDGKEEYLKENKKIATDIDQLNKLNYYNKLGKVIKNYNNIVLFGPSSAKTELLNILRADIDFKKIKIEVKQTYKMRENQQQGFVEEYFSSVHSEQRSNPMSTLKY